MTDPAPAEERLAFAGAVLLDHLASDEVALAGELEGDDASLAAVLGWLRRRELVEVVDGVVEMTDRGRRALDRFLSRYLDYVKTMDIYGAVDLEEGTFAFERIFDVQEEADWQAYLAEDRWEDLRLAVAEYKDIDPGEVVLLSLLHEGRFDPTEPGWQEALTSEDLWDEVDEILESALRIEDLAYEDDDGPVSGREVIEDVIQQGAELNQDLKAREAEAIASGELVDEGDDEDDPYTAEAYEAYLDPAYVPPCWAGEWWS
ncbi:MAG: hypothetical protein ACFCGT_21245 [Sandaracinaceae bacterium]